MTQNKRLDFQKAKEKMKTLSSLLDKSDVICLYISPKDFPASADFLRDCWNNQNVSPNMFNKALKDGYFDKLLTNHKNLDVFVWTQNVCGLFINGKTIPVPADKYPGV